MSPTRTSYCRQQPVDAEAAAADRLCRLVAPTTALRPEIDSGPAGARCPTPDTTPLPAVLSAANAPRRPAIRRRRRDKPAAISAVLPPSERCPIPPGGRSGAGRPAQRSVGCRTQALLAACGAPVTRPAQTRPDQTGPDQTRPDQTSLAQTGPDQIVTCFPVSLCQQRHLGSPALWETVALPHLRDAPCEPARR